MAEVSVVTLAGVGRDRLTFHGLDSEVTAPTHTSEAGEAERAVDALRRRIARQCKTTEPEDELPQTDKYDRKHEKDGRMFRHLGQLAMLL